jgi:hypothetical protein
MTSLRDGLFQQAAALAPATVLRSLTGADESPEVIVHLSGGQLLTGRPVSIGADRGQDVVVLAHAGRLGYALLANVVAVEMHDPGRFQDILTEGRLPQPVSGEPRTRLALRREFAPTEEFPLQLDWAAVPDSGPELANLERLLGELRSIGREVRADELGRQAWARTSTVRVEHDTGARLTVESVPGALSVRADLTAALPRELAGELRRRINMLL